MGKNEGMTLIEVMLAVAILGFSFTVLLTAASRCIAAIKQAQIYQQAQWTMAMGEAEFPLMKTNDVENLSAGPETYDNGLTYMREVEDDEDEDGLYVVRSRVSWSSHGTERFEEAVFYIFKPIEDEDETSGGGSSKRSGNGSPKRSGRGSSGGGNKGSSRGGSKPVPVPVGNGPGAVPK